MMVSPPSRTRRPPTLWFPGSAWEPITGEAPPRVFDWARQSLAISAFPGRAWERGVAGSPYGSVRQGPCNDFSGAQFVLAVAGPLSYGIAAAPTGGPVLGG